MADVKTETVTIPREAYNFLMGPSRVMLDELDKGISNLVAALDDTQPSDTFWYRYWAGYLHGYETLRDKLRAAIAMETRRGETPSGSVEDDSAAIAQGTPQ